MKCIKCGENVRTVEKEGREHYLCPEGHLSDRMLDHDSVASYEEDGETTHRSVGAILKDQGEVLLLKRRKYPFKLTLPAGHLEEKDDSGLEAVRREVKEETGLEIDLDDFEKIFDGRIKDKCRRGADHHHWQLFEVELEERNGVRVNEEAESYTWATRQDVEKLELTRPTEEFLIKKELFSF